MESAKESIKQKASNSEIYGKMQAVFIEMDSSPVVSSLNNANYSSTLVSSQTPPQGEFCM